MTDRKLVDLTALGAAPETDDILLIGDVSTSAPNPTMKKITIANLFDATIAAENGSTTPGVGNSFDTATVIASNTMYMLTVRVVSGANAVVGHTVSYISRQGTGTLVSNAVTNAFTTVACDSGTGYEVRITNAGALDYTYGYALMRLQ